MIPRRVIERFRKQELTDSFPAHPGESRDPVLFAWPFVVGAALSPRHLHKEELGPGFRRDERVEEATTSERIP